MTHSARSGDTADLVMGEGASGVAAASAETGWVLAGLRVSLHVCFAGLLAFAWVRTALQPGWHVAEMVLSVLLALWYLCGTVLEKRLSQHGRPVERVWVLCWTLVTVAIWLALLCLQVDYTWLAFPLFFLVQYLVSRYATTSRSLWIGSIVTVALVLVPLWVRQWSPHGFGGIIGPTIGAVLAVVMFQAYRTMHLQNRAMAITERRAGVLAERDRLAREIHDTLTQGLASIVLMSRAATDSLHRNQVETALDQVGIIEQAAKSNLDESRRFVRDLRVPEGDLAELLDQTVERFADQQRAAGRPIKARFVAHGPSMPVSDATTQALLRTTQSSLANVAEHAEASKVEVVLRLGEQIELQISDDGRGFDRSRLDEHTGGRGVGLASVSRRVGELDGEVVVDAAPGRGTTVRVRLPL